jgi:hypothetical protein
MATSSRASVQRLVRLLRSQEARSRYDAAVELGRRGVDAIAAVSALITALDDREWYWARVRRDRVDWTEHRPVREAAMHALACIDPNPQITGVRAGEVIVGLLCEERGQSRTGSETWADHWSGDGLARIKPFGLPVRRILVTATSSKDIGRQIAACRVLAAWDREVPVLAQVSDKA